MPQRPPDPQRRQILRRTRNAAAASAALAVLGPMGPAAAQAPDPVRPAREPTDGRGYHETEHTRRYYDLARF
jgi:hypothetical protein